MYVTLMDTYISLDIIKCLGKCHSNASCEKVDESYSCICHEGYHGNGYGCKSKSNLINFL